MSDKEKAEEIYPCCYCDNRGTFNEGRSKCLNTPHAIQKDIAQALKEAREDEREMIIKENIKPIEIEHYCEDCEESSFITIYTDVIAKAIRERGVRL